MQVSKESKSCRTEVLDVKQLSTLKGKMKRAFELEFFIKDLSTYNSNTQDVSPFPQASIST